MSASRIPLLGIRTLAWTALVPAGVAAKQAAWELERLVERANRAGATFAQIGARLGVSAVRVHQLVSRVRRQERPSSPVELWLADDRELRMLAVSAPRRRFGHDRRAHPEEVLRLRGEGLTFAAIGQALGVSEAVACKAWHKARCQVERVRKRENQALRLRPSLGR